MDRVTVRGPSHGHSCNLLFVLNRHVFAITSLLVTCPRIITQNVTGMLYEFSQSFYVFLTDGTRRQHERRLATPPAYKPETQITPDKLSE